MGAVKRTHPLSVRIQKYIKRKRRAKQRPRNKLEDWLLNEMSRMLYKMYDDAILFGEVSNDR